MDFFRVRDNISMPSWNRREQPDVFVEVNYYDGEYTSWTPTSNENEASWDEENQV